MNDRLRELVGIDGMQFGFMPGRGTTDAILILRRQDKFFEGEQQVLLWVVDLEKESEQVPRKVL